jgi:hypothetical protein
MDEWVEEAVATDVSAGLYAKFGGDEFERESESGIVYAPY